ncbi:MAG: MFS transporter [Chitinophagaceae bacterium]
MRAENPVHARYAVSLLFFLCGVVFTSWASRIPAFKEQFHLNEAELGGVLFMLPMGSLIALPFAGWAVDRVGSRLMGPLSLVLYAVALYALSLSPTIFTLSAALFAFGFIGNTVNIAINTHGLDVQHLMNKPILASFHAMWSVGALCGALLGGWTLRNNYSTGTHYLMVLIPLTLLSVASYFFMLRIDDKQHESKKLFALPDKALMLIGVICLCSTLCEGAMADWSALYYQSVLEDVTVKSTTGFTAYAFTMSVGRFTGDKLIHWMGYRKVLMMDALLIAGGMGLALASSLPVLVIIGFALVGYGVSTVIPIAYMVAGRSKTMRPSVALAAVSTVGFTGFLIGPPVIGFIAHEIGLRSALALVVVLAIAIFALSSRIKRD